VLSLGAVRFIPRPSEVVEFLHIIEEVLRTHERQELAPSVPLPTMDETAYLRAYNAALVRKLEDKVLQLEELNRTLEQKVAERTAELQRLVDAMAGREIRMAQLKEAIRRLRAQLIAHGLEPEADDPLHQDDFPSDA